MLLDILSEVQPEVSKKGFLMVERISNRGLGAHPPDSNKSYMHVHIMKINIIA